MTNEEAIRRLRADPRFAELIRDSYLDFDVLGASERFLASAEFAEVRKLLDGLLTGGTVLDLGAGTGIASRALAKSGAQLVYALEPDPSDEIGQNAIRRLMTDAPIEIVGAFAEKIPIPAKSVDVVYARQVLHHVPDLPSALKECARVLKSGGAFLGCREHVVDDEEQLREFLAHHPVHQLAGGENAFRLDEYTSAILSADLRLDKVFGPWDTVINAFPEVCTSEELRRYPRTLLKRRFGRTGALASLVPGVNKLIWKRLKRPIPGRLYSFFATKP